MDNYRLRIFEEGIRKLGSAKSGFKGHKGRPGRRGGSLPRSRAFGTSEVEKVLSLDESKGVNESMILVFADGTRGIFKPSPMVYGSVDSEVLAFQFSESIGWDIVPETIKYEYEGDYSLEKETGSLQKWVGNSVSGIHAMGEGSSEERFLAEERIAVMDAVFHHVDRNSSNLIYDDKGKGRPWAIDNGGIFHTGFAREKLPFVPSKFTPNTSTLRRVPIRDSVWEDVGAWAKTPKAKTYIQEVRTAFGDERADTLNTFLESL